MWTCAGVLALATCAFAVTLDQFYPVNNGRAEKLQTGHEVPSKEYFLKVPVVFYGETYDTVFVNNFGVLSFRADIPSFINTEFPLPYPSIAAFYTNVDTSQTGEVVFRESDEPHIVSKAEETVQNNFHEYYDFKPKSVFIATWLGVPPYESNDKKNSFQIAIISNGTESFAELLYPEREIQWVQRDMKQESLPDAKAQVGFMAEDGRMFTLRGSGSHQIRNIALWSNTHEPGKYIFRIGNLSPEENIAVPDQYNQNEIEFEEESKTCALSGPSVCHVHAKCVDYQAGICCQCNDGYYGNGKSCIKDNIPLRVHGQLNGIINNVHLNDIDIQAYVVMDDGRAYTALSLAPPSLGSSLQLLNVLGGVVGWLFAKPFGNAINGYQLTGSLFNHTADVWFPDTNHRVTIHQEYFGHDVFDQITIETDIRGTLPAVMDGVKLEESEYDETYTIGEDGFIRSESARTYTNKATGEKYNARISQSFTHNRCKYAPKQSLPPMILKVSKIYLGNDENKMNEVKGNIVRYGMSNKIVSLVGQEDPCIEGQKTCGPYSTCVVQDSSFVCVCQTGFTNIYHDNALVCVDIDECVAGIHNCDSNADCINHIGTFQCTCRDGYDGNGVSCNRRTLGCQDRKCDVNAQCVESEDGPLCLCNPGYTGDGQWCWQTAEYACSQCSRFASCPFSSERNGYACVCNSGFSGDGYQCVEDIPNQNLVSPYPSPYTPTNNPSSQHPTFSPFRPSVSPLLTVSDAPAPSYPDTPSYEQESTTPTTSEAEYNESVVLPICDDISCGCPPGYVSFKDGRNDLCRLEDNNNNQTPPLPDTSDSIIACLIDNECPPNAVCLLGSEYDEEQGHCVCPDGYIGDVYECIERPESNCSCGLNARCVETAGEMICVCDSGYQGDGYYCRPNFRCNNDSDCEYNAECKPNRISGEYICQCIDGYIKDQNDACIPDGQQCNGALCVEHASCLFDQQIGVNFCHCDEGYNGDGTSQCVPVGRTCEVTHDCHVEATCTFADNTYQCICRDGFVGDGYNCNPEPNCRNFPYMCSEHASCLKRSDGYVCECNSGYYGNGSLCVINPKLSGNFLVVSEGATIFRVPFQITPREYATPFNSAIDQIAVGIDVDCVSGHIYWGDVVGNTIKRAGYDGSRYEKFLYNGVKSPEGVSIDWSARNIFWTDSKKLTIEVANLETRVRKVLFAIDGIFNPRGIVVHPQRGKIFWSDWKRSGPKIEWANMDGTQRGVFLDSSEVKLPNSLAIDWLNDRLCYADAGLFSIKCVSIETQERFTIAKSLTHPFSLAIKGDIFYWTDWKTMRIEYMDTRTGVRGQLPVPATSRPYGLAVAPDACPPARNVCWSRNGGCEPTQLCLPDGQGGRTCLPGDASFDQDNNEI